MKTLPLFDTGPVQWDGDGRDPLDRYYTPESATEELLKYMGARISGVVWEPCCGADMIGRVVRKHPGIKRVVLTDVDPDSAREAHFDFIGPYWVNDFQGLPGSPEWASVDFDWILSNFPYSIPYDNGTATATDFTRRALEMDCGLAALYRLSWLEPCKEREDIFRDYPPTDVLILPRVHYINAPGSNNMTSAWVIWDPAKRGEQTVRWAV